ncbi:MAG: hypothetical protein NZT92_01005 [Abditibacteriales bacterium]|nr:hypothetical protein [Abditibacteriales bacterium]MDW8364379.1 hypothetical protein [Abditibacteriales bacterium]
MSGLTGPMWTIWGNSLACEVADEGFDEIAKAHELNRVDKINTKKVEAKTPSKIDDLIRISPLAETPPRLSQQQAT